MTREEANKELERAFDVLDHTCHMDNRRKEAFNMARVALSAEPCEDCISRKAVLDLVEDMTDQFGVEHRVITEGVISMLPPVTPKPKTDVLDKIMKEIKEIYADIDDVCIKNGINLVRRIINKYTAESEDKE